MPAFLAAMHHRSENPDAEIREEVESFLLARTAAASGSDPDGALEPCMHHPGYLVRTLDQRSIYVPFNLASVCPRSDVLVMVSDIATTIRIDANDPICISGSTTFLGAIPEVGDLDFCEYFLGEEEHFPDAALRVCDTTEVPLVWMKCGAEELAQPWEGCGDRLKAAYRELEEKRIKLDFMSLSDLGLLPTTSVVLATSGEDGAAGSSFAYQEAVVADRTPVRDLVSPTRFGAYVDWLRQQVGSMVGENASNLPPFYVIKALKRALSLMLIAGYEKEVERIVSRLHNSELSVIVKRMRLGELERMAATFPGGPPASYQAALETLQGEVEDATDDDLSEALEAARDVARTALRVFEADFQEYV